MPQLSFEVSNINNFHVVHFGNKKKKTTVTKIEIPFIESRK